MSRRFSSLLAVILGVVALRLIFTGEYLNYVKRGMFVWLLLSALVLMATGVMGWLSALREPEEVPDADGCCSTDGSHSHSLSRAAWLLLLPVLAVGLAQPAPLGAFAANRQSVRPPQQVLDVAAIAERVSAQSASAAAVPKVADPAPDPVAGEQAEPGESGDDSASVPSTVAGLAIPQPVAGEVGEMSLLDFLEITYYDDRQVLAGIPVRLVGFVVAAQDGSSGEFLISRFMINCCAADATLMQAGVKGVRGGVPAEETWVSVTGRWDPSTQGQKLTAEGFPIPELVAEKVEIIAAPENPYIALSDF